MRTITTEAERDHEIHLLAAEIDHRLELTARCATEVDSVFVSATGWLQQELRWMRAVKLPFLIHEETMDGRKLLEVESLGRS